MFILVLLIIVLVILIWIAYKLYNYALNPNSSKKGIFNTNNKNELRKEDLWINDFNDKSSVYINSFDNLRLHAYEIKESNSNKWAITVHGYTANAEYMSSIAYKYYTLGYNLIVPDLRGHGKSEGHYIGMGWHDRLDIIKWIEYILNKDENAQILLHGISMGAATVMMVSGEELPKNVKVINEDCGYTGAKEQLAYKLKNMFKLPSFPLLNICSIITKIKAKYFISEASAIDQIKKSKTPILFIHGDKDKFVPFYMLEELYNGCNAYKDKLIINNAGHAKCEKVDSDLYWDKVITFISKFIK